MKPRSPKLRKAYRILSSVFLGVFTGVILTFVWFVVPWLRDFPVGDDSPTAIGFPVGFCLGAYLAAALNRRFNWGRCTFHVGAFFLIVAVCTVIAFYYKADNTTGWDGLGWLVALVVAACAAIAFLGLTLAGLFSHLGKQNPPPVSSP